MEDSLDKCYPKIPERLGKYLLFSSFFSKEKKVGPGYWPKQYLEHITNKKICCYFMFDDELFIDITYNVYNSIKLMPITLSVMNFSRNAFVPTLCMGCFLAKQTSFGKLH